MPILVHCQDCAFEFRVLDEHAGTSGTCPSCGGSVSVPTVAEIEALAGEDAGWSNWADADNDGGGGDPFEQSTEDTPLPVRPKRPKPKMKPVHNGWRFPVPTTLSVTALLALFPWVHVSCEAQPKGAAANFGGMSMTVVSQSGIELVTGGASVAELARVNQEIAKEDEWLKQGAKPVPLIAVGLGAVLLAIILGFALTPGTIGRKVVLLTCTLTALGILVFYVIMPFPLETATAEKLKTDPPEDDTVKIIVGKTKVYWISLVTVAIAVLFSVIELFLKPTPIRRRGAI